MFFQIITHTATTLVSIGTIGVALVWLAGTTFSSNKDFNGLESKFEAVEKSYIKDVAQINQKQAVHSVKIERIETDVKEIKQQGREILKILQRR